MRRGTGWGLGGPAGGARGNACWEGLQIQEEKKSNHENYQQHENSCFAGAGL